MFTGEKVILRATTEADIPRIYKFSQDVELAGLDCAVPRAFPSERTHADFQNELKDNPRTAFFAIEAGDTMPENAPSESSENK